MVKIKEEIAIFMKNLNITEEQAVELYEYDRNIEKSTKPVVGEVVVTKQRAVKKGGIQQDELVQMKEILSKGFAGKTIQNKDITPIMSSELGLNGRQTPSRLARLADEGFLELLGGSPKQYKVPNE